MSETGAAESPRRILLVDDATANRQLLTTLLTEHGYVVYPASDGERALEFIRTTLLDLVLLDIRMPGMDGYEVCRRLKADEATRSIPVIFLILPEDEGEKVRVFQEGGADYITRPFQPDEVLARIRTQLRLRELTERQEADRTAALLGVALNHVREAAFLIDRAARFHFVNEEACRLLGYARTDMLGMGVQDVDPDFPLGRWPGHWAELESKRSMLFEGRHKTKDGRIFPVEINANYFEYDGGAYNLALVRDITGRMQVDEALRESEKRYRELLSSVTDYIYTVEVRDGESVATVHGPGCVAVTGYAPEDYAADPDLWYRMVPDEDRPAVFKQAADILSGRAVSPLEHRIYHRDGTLRWVRHTPVPRYDARGGLTAYDGLIANITERRQAEEDVLHERLLLSQIMETSPVAITTVSTDGVLTFANSQAESLLGLSKDEITQRAYNAPEWHITGIDGGPIADERLPFQQVMAARRPVFDVRHAIEWPDGRRLLLSINGAPLFGEHGKIESVVFAMEDITRRSEAEQALRESEQKYRDIFDNVLDGLYLLEVTEDGRFRTLDVNSALERSTGIPRQQVIGKTQEEVVPPPVAEIVNTKYRHCVEAAHPIEEEAMLELPGGTRYYHSTLIPLRNEQNRVHRIIGISRDITGSKQAEAERMVHLHFLESMDRINMAIVTAKGLDQMMSGVLDLVLAIFECDRAFLLYPCDPGSPTWTVTVESTRPEYPGVLALGLEVPMTPPVAETLQSLLDADGCVKFGPGTSHPLPEDAAERFGFRSLLSMALRPRIGLAWQFGLHQCSSARTWTAEEERLFIEIGRRLADGLTTLLSHREVRESEGRYRRIVETAGEGIWTLGPDLMTTFINARMSEMTGYSAEELLGRPFTDIMFPEDVPDHHARLEARQRGISENYERRIRRKDGTTVWTIISASPVFDNEHRFQGTLAMFTDITERKRADEELARHREHLEELVQERTVALETANRELEAFAYSVSHDLRAPLRHIDGFVGLLKRQIESTLDEQGRHYMARISEGVKRMAGLIDDLLSFSRMGRQEMSVKPVNLAELITEVIQELESDVGSRNVTWRIGDIPVVHGDPSMLRIVMTNLLSNALKFTRPRESAVIEIGSHLSETEVVVSVRDNGVGFNPAYSARLFGVFQRLHAIEEFEGTGIGLAISQRIIVRHGGRIWAEGQVDGGATFFFALPQPGQGVRRGAHTPEADAYS